MNAQDLRACRHEALHAVAAQTLGRRVYAVSRDRHGGETLWKSSGADPYDVALITLMPFLEDQAGCEDDIKTVLALGDAGVDLIRVTEAAERLRTNPDFRRRVRAVEEAMEQHPALSGEEVSLLIAASDETRTEQ